MPPRKSCRPKSGNRGGIGMARAGGSFSAMSRKRPGCQFPPCAVKTRPAEQFNPAVGTSRKAQVPVLFVNSPIQAPRQRAPIKAGEHPSHRFIEGRLNSVIGVQDLQKVRFRREFQTPVEILEQAEVGRVANELAGHSGKTPDNFFRAVGRAIVQHHDAVGTQRLSRNGFQRLRNKFLAVANGDGGDDSGFQGRPD